MSDFKTATTSSVISDLTKRVRYATGLVLGVDEFEQEQAYLLEQNHLHYRALHGYGTVHGLRVTMGAPDAEDPSDIVQVTPGLAVDPMGRTICVDQTQCGSLVDWMNRQENIPFRTEGETRAASVYVVLCYRECETDAVPVPGSPCRSAEDSAVPSRVQDDFELMLTTTRPTHTSEAMTRAFGAFLQRVVVTEHIGAEEETQEGPMMPPGSAPDLKDRAGILDAFDAWLDAYATDADIETGPLRIPAGEADIILRALFERWATVGRTRLFGGDASRCSPLEEADRSPNTCVLLAELDVPVDESDVPVAEDIVVHTDSRPVLLDTRLLQERLMHGSLAQERRYRTLGSLLIEGNSVGEFGVAVYVHAEVNGLPDAVVGVTINGQNVTVLDPSAGPDENPFPIGLDASIMPGDVVAVQLDLSALTPRFGGDGSLLDDLDASGAPDYLDREGTLVTVRGVAPDLALSALTDVDAFGPGAGSDLIWNDSDGVWVASDTPAMHEGDPARGDLIDTYPNPRVGALRGYPIAAQEPQAGQVLVWNDGPTPAESPNEAVVNPRRSRDVSAEGGVGDAQTVQGRWTPTTLDLSGGGDTEPVDTLTIEEVAQELPTLPFATVTPICFEKLVEDEIGDTRDRLKEAVETYKQLREEERQFHVFRVWMHLNAGASLPEDNVWQTNFNAFTPAIFAERNTKLSGAPFLSRATLLAQVAIDRNVAVLFVEQVQKTERLPYFRFRFRLADVPMFSDGSEDELNAKQWLAKRPVKWEGHDGREHVTVFAELPTPCVEELNDLKDVEAAGVEPNEVLAYVDGAWRPTKIDTSSGGATTLEGLQDVDFIQVDPDTGDKQEAVLKGGEVLVYNPDLERWTPQIKGGDFVNAMGAGAYAVVAAGIYDADTKTTRPYNGFAVTPERDGSFLVTFNNFNSDLDYVVKATARDTDIDGIPMGVKYDIVPDKGIRIGFYFLINGDPILQPTGFCAEISQFQADKTLNRFVDLGDYRTRLRLSNF